MEQKLNLGQIIIGPKERDATHIAVLPVVAAENLKAGVHVGLSRKGEACQSAEHVGIVDPFLKTKVLQGDKFWLFMYPNTITGLRHEWSHPILSKVENSKKEDEKAAFYGRDCHGYSDVPNAEELFHHLSVVLGQTIDRAYFEDNGYFSCSC